jgi:hypothetical protein
MAFVPRHDALSWGRIVRTPQLVASPRFREDLFGLIAARPATVTTNVQNISIGDFPNCLSVPRIGSLVAELLR